MPLELPEKLVVVVEAGEDAVLRHQAQRRQPGRLFSPHPVALRRQSRFQAPDLGARFESGRDGLLGRLGQRRRPRLFGRTDAVARRQPEYKRQQALSVLPVRFESANALAGPGDIQFSPLQLDRKFAALAGARAHRRGHALEPLDLSLDEPGGAPEPFRLQIQLDGAQRHFRALRFGLDRRAPDRLARPRQLVAEAAVHYGSHGASLDHGRRRALDAHREAAGVRQAAAGVHLGDEGVAGDLDAFAGGPLGQPRQRHLRIPLECPGDDLAQSHLAHLGAGAGGGQQQHDQNLFQAFFSLAAQPAPAAHPPWMRLSSRSASQRGGCSGLKSAARYCSSSSRALSKLRFPSI